MKKMDIIYEDKELLAVNKPSKLLTISDGKDNNTLYSMAREYVKKQHKSNKIFIVHRLDRDTSGVVLFAKSEALKKYLQDNWNKITDREYLGVVEGYLKDNKGVIKEYLLEDKTHRVYATNKKIGQYAETHYEVINRKYNCTLVKIKIKTGKKNQIRVGFSNIGHPILGDKKYGSKNNSLKRLCLHSLRLQIDIKGKKYLFETNPPKELEKFLK